MLIYSLEPNCDYSADRAQHFKSRTNMPDVGSKRVQAYEKQDAFSCTATTLRITLSRDRMEKQCR